MSYAESRARQQSALRLLNILEDLIERIKSYSGCSLVLLQISELVAELFELNQEIRLFIVE